MLFLGDIVSTDNSTIAIEMFWRRGANSLIFYRIGKQYCISSDQCIKQFFNFSFDLCKLNLIGDRFRIYFFPLCRVGFESS